MTQQLFVHCSMCGKRIGLTGQATLPPYRCLSCQARFNFFITSSAGYADDENGDDPDERWDEPDR